MTTAGLIRNPVSTRSSTDSGTEPFFPKGEGGGDSTVLHTVDGAKHWTQLPVWEHGGFEPANLLLFADPTHGWMWWMDGQAQNHRSRTNDGGRTWQDRKTDDTGTLIKFFDPRRGLAIGGPFDAPSLLVTEDGAETWVSRPLPTGVHFAECFSFVDPVVGFIAGNGSDRHLAVVSTPDGGTTWTKGAIPPYTDVQVMDCTRSGAANAWLVVWHDNERGSELLWSTDAGRTWTKHADPLTNGPRYYVNTVHFLTDSLGFAFAWRTGGKGSDLLATRDGGIHWSRESHLASQVTECAVFEGKLWCTAGLDILKVRPDPQ